MWERRIIKLLGNGGKCDGNLIFKTLAFQETNLLSMNTHAREKIREMTILFILEFQHPNNKSSKKNKREGLKGRNILGTNKIEHE